MKVYFVEANTRPAPYEIDGNILKTFGPLETITDEDGKLVRGYEVTETPLETIAAELQDLEGSLDDLLTNVLPEIMGV